MPKRDILLLIMKLGIVSRYFSTKDNPFFKNSEMQQCTMTAFYCPVDDEIIFDW